MCTKLGLGQCGMGRGVLVSDIPQGPTPPHKRGLSSNQPLCSSLSIPLARRCRVHETFGSRQMYWDRSCKRDPIRCQRRKWGWRGDGCVQTPTRSNAPRRSGYQLRDNSRDFDIFVWRLGVKPSRLPHGRSLGDGAYKLEKKVGWERRDEGVALVHHRFERVAPVALFPTSK